MIEDFSVREWTLLGGGISIGAIVGIWIYNRTGPVREFFSGIWGFIRGK